MFLLENLSTQDNEHSPQKERMKAISLQRAELISEHILFSYPSSCKDWNIIQTRTNNPKTQVSQAIKPGSWNGLFFNILPVLITLHYSSTEKSCQRIYPQKRKYHTHSIGHPECPEHMNMLIAQFLLSPESFFWYSKWHHLSPSCIYVIGSLSLFSFLPLSNIRSVPR